MSQRILMEVTMVGVRLSEHCGIIVRKAALHDKGIARARLMQVMETEAPLDEDQELLSFGPHFGGEAQSTLLQRLHELGLADDDLYYLPFVLPDWAHLYVAARVEHPCD